MKLPTLFLLLIVTITISVASYADESGNDLNMPSHDFILSETAETSTFLRGPSRFLAQQKLPANYTCNKFPRVCRLKGSAGPDCCKKNCVNVKTDRLNCGMCGYKCKYTEICCKGSCVNASFDKRHCGGCNKKCRKGEFCVYGMCNYA